MILYSIGNLANIILLFLILTNKNGLKLFCYNYNSITSNNVCSESV